MTKRSSAGNLTRLEAVEGRDRYRWRMRYRGRSRNTVGTPAEARKALGKFVVEVDDGRAKAGTPPTVETLLRDYMARPELAVTTKLTVGQIVNVHLAPLHPVQADKLTAQQVENLYRDLLAAGLKGPTVVRVHEVLRAALRRAARLELIDRAITDRVKPPPATRTITFDSLDTATVLALLERAWERSPLLGAFATFAAATGCRRGEIVALQWADIDLRRGVADISKALGHVGEGQYVVKSTKTGVGRKVHVDPIAVDALRRWRRVQDTGRVAADPPRGGYVFTPDESRLTSWSAAAASNQWAAMVAAAGLGKVRLHDLRHWFASASIAGGADINMVARQLGHSTPGTTLKVYSHVVQDRPVHALTAAVEAHQGDGATVTALPTRTKEAGR